MPKKSYSKGNTSFSSSTPQAGPVQTSNTVGQFGSTSGAGGNTQLNLENKYRKNQEGVEVKEADEVEEIGNIEERPEGTNVAKNKRRRKGDHEDIHIETIKETKGGSSHDRKHQTVLPDEITFPDDQAPLIAQSYPQTVRKKPEIQHRHHKNSTAYYDQEVRESHISNKNIPEASTSFSASRYSSEFRPPGADPRTAPTAQYRTEIGQARSGDSQYYARQHYASASTGRGGLLSFSSSFSFSTSSNLNFSASPRTLTGPSEQYANNTSYIQNMYADQPYHYSGQQDYNSMAPGEIISTSGPHRGGDVGLVAGLMNLWNRSLETGTNWFEQAMQGNDGSGRGGYNW